MARRPPPRLITLTSDIGSAYAAQMKAVLARRRPAGTIIDLAHDLRSHAIGEAAFLLRAMAVGFPAGTVHVAVIDPGVGGRRAPIIVACEEGSMLVGPDNGVLLPLAEALGDPHAFRVDPDRLAAGERVGTTFDGRDVFAPTAARLADGVPPTELGTPIQPRHYEVPQPTVDRGGARGEVVHEDRFGNLISNIPTGAIPPRTGELSVRFGVGAARRLPFASSYEGVRRGRAGCLGSSFGLVEVAVAEGSAARRFRASVGSPVELRWGPRARPR
ncbi:MAG TPA: SAM-dependent chlorinase/fluorinase [Thermoplasmata archaeon]|nr:SAM-dependent chlorinase/fluorinase [Thermoplasmata archaeon]